ncbi:hypothetical protein CRG98_003309 [Punica granatum]|uniref:Uncharacterized protein n=1 Tax=Punica granatum TaxID=22663 RepID=A0A2I0L6P1_PUNGR|nr:hypothetical protein CRG98_003309 [Punica granatum]
MGLVIDGWALNPMCNASYGSGLTRMDKQPHKKCGPECALIEARMQATESRRLGVSTFPGDARDKDSPLLVYDPKVKGRLTRIALESSDKIEYAPEQTQLGKSRVGRHHGGFRWYFVAWLVPHVNQGTSRGDRGGRLKKRISSRSDLQGKP